MFRTLGRFASVKPRIIAKKHAPLKKVDFNDDTIFVEKSMWSLLRTLVVLRLCRIPYLSKNAVSLMKRAEHVIGPYLTYNTIVKATAFGHFCAGEDERELKYTVKGLERQGIGSVLDYAAEADVEGFAPHPGAEEAPNLSMASIVHNMSVKYPQRERLYEENMKLYVMCIMHASLNQPVNGVGLAAVKVTGMCDPQLLARVSAILHSVHRGWVRHFTCQEPPPIEECRVVMGTKKEHQLYISNEQARHGLVHYGTARAYTEAELDAVMELLDPKKEGRVNYYQFKKAVSEAVLALEPTPTQQLIVEKLPRLTDEERGMWRALHRRLNLIVRTASDLHVRVLFDAEQTFYQLAIDNIVVQFQRTYNLHEPTVYNTYQCYLTYTEDRIFNDLTRAEQEGWIWGGKIVRGAYMGQERETAAHYGYKSPVWPTYEETNACYKACTERIMKEFVRAPEKNYEVFFGTHNKKSVQDITDAVRELPPEVNSITVLAQLYGMADNLTIPLKKAGFRVFKYLPYGPVKETIHYLGRRAVENSSILTGDSDEIRLIRKELRRRLFWFSKK